MTRGRRTTTYTGMIHALCNAHAVRELIYVTDTATGEVADHAQQAATALRRLNRLIADARTAEKAPDAEKVAFYLHVLHSAVVLGVAATAARGSKLERKYHALFVRLRDRRDDYLRFVTDPAVLICCDDPRTLALFARLRQTPAVAVSRLRRNSSICRRLGRDSLGGHVPGRRGSRGPAGRGQGLEFRRASAQVRCLRTVFGGR